MTLSSVDIFCKLRHTISHSPRTFVLSKGQRERTIFRMLTGVRLNRIGRFVRFVTGLPASVTEYLTQQETVRIATKRLNDMLEAAYLAQIKTIRVVNSHGNFTRATGIPATKEGISVQFTEMDVCDFLSILNFFGLDENPKKCEQKNFELRRLGSTATIEFSLDKSFSSETLTLRLTFSLPPTDQSA